LKKYEYLYIGLTFTLIGIEFLMAIPSLIDSYLLADYSWLLLTFCIMHLLGFLLKSFSLIKTNCVAFNSLGILAWVLNPIPVIAIIVHIVTGFIGIYQIVPHMSKIKEYYKGYDVKKNKEKLKKELVNEDDFIAKYSKPENKTTLEMFLEQELQTFPDEYVDIESDDKIVSKNRLGVTINNPGSVVVDKDSFVPKTTKDDLNWQVGLFGDNILEDVDFEDLEKLHDDN
jgi:hypothetical protein